MSKEFQNKAQSRKTLEVRKADHTSLATSTSAAVSPAAPSGGWISKDPGDKADHPSADNPEHLGSNPNDHTVTIAEIAPEPRGDFITVTTCTAV